MAVSWMLVALLAGACPAQDGVLRAAATAVQAQYLDEAEGARIADALRTGRCSSAMRTAVRIRLRSAHA